jgi:3-methyladenine DNA glycosylase AlkD
MTSAAAELIRLLRSLRGPGPAPGHHHFGIVTKAERLDISLPTLRRVGRPHRGDHALALELWASGIFDARMLAAIIDDPLEVTRRQADRWVRDCDNWALTDAVAYGLVDRTPFAEEKILLWSKRREEFVKRAAFSAMAGMAVHRKELPSEFFLKFLPIIAREATDERNFVRKAVNWALRQIGKRDRCLRRAAIASAQEIQRIDSRAARWIAADALRELKR